MDANEIIALSIVAVAVLLAARCLLGKKGSSCCNPGCLPGNGPKVAPKEKNKKNEDKK